MTNQDILLSICIPTYNRPTKLSNAIASVLRQKIENYELIICDNASTDNTKDVIESFCDPSIKYFFYENLVSMYANHNRCLKHSRGQWIVYLHSDDLLINIENIITIINTIPSYCDCIFPFTSNSLVYCNWKYLDILMIFNGCSPSGSLYRRNSLNEIGGFKEDNIIADWEVLLDFVNQGKIIFSYDPNQLSFIERINDGQNSYLKSIKDGSAHQGKSLCIKRQFMRLGEKSKIHSTFEKIIEVWNNTQILKLSFYLYLGGLALEADSLIQLAHKKGKYFYYHPRYFYALLAKFLKINYFLFFYKKLRLIF